MSCQYFDNSNQVCLINQLSYNTEVNGYQGYTSTQNQTNSSSIDKNKQISKLDYEQQQNLLNQYKINKKKQRSEKSLATAAEQTNSFITSSNELLANQSIENIITNSANSTPNIMSAKTKQPNHTEPTSPSAVSRQSRRSSNNPASSPNTPKLSAKSESRNKSTSILKRFSFKFKSSSQGPDKSSKSSNQTQSNTTLNHINANSTKVVTNKISSDYTSTPTSPQLSPKYSSVNSTPQSPRRNFNTLDGRNHYTPNPYLTEKNKREQEKLFSSSQAYIPQVKQKRVEQKPPPTDSSSTENNLSIDTMQKVFSIFDRDQDGSITIEDVQVVMESLHYLKDEIEFPSIDQIKIAFDKFDENRNGKIEFNEFINILKHAGAVQSTPPGSKSTSFINNNYQQQSSYSSNNYYPNNGDNGDATKSTILNNNASYFNNDINKTSSPSSSPTNMRQLFDQFDKDHDGRITKNELNFVMCNLFPDEIITEQDVNEMMDAADLDRNGFIDYNEFANMFNLYSNTSKEIQNQQKELNNYPNHSGNAKSNAVSLAQLNHLENVYSSGTLRAYNRSDSANLSRSPDLNKSSKSLSKRSVSKEKEGKRSRTQSQTVANSNNTLNSANQSPYTFRKVVQIFTSSQMMDLKSAFTMFDKNGDQRISESELYDVMNYLGLKTTPKEVKAMIQVVDTNRNGYIDYDEFVKMMTQAPVKPLTADEELQKTFEIFDIDRNGYISADEIKRTMQNLGENLTDEEVNNMVKAADKNCDGKIDIKEFSALLRGVGDFKL